MRVACNNNGSKRLAAQTRNPEIGNDELESTINIINKTFNKYDQDYISPHLT